VKSTRLKSIAMFASVLVAVGLIQQINFDSHNDAPNTRGIVYATEKPSDSIPFCGDERLPIHAFCENLDSQTLPRYEQLKDLSFRVVDIILERLDSR
jgi:hypothetical protein